MLSKCLLALCALTVASDLAAQSVSDLSMTPAVIGHWDHLKGARVRIRPQGRDSAGAPTVEGTVVEAHADSLYLAVAGQDVPRLVIADRSSVEEWYRADPTKAVTVIGVVVGAALGGAVAKAVNRPPPKATCTESYDSVGAALGCALAAGITNTTRSFADQTGAVAMGVLLGGAVGGILGRHLGHKSIREGWRAVALRRLDIQPTRRGGVQIGAQLKF